MKNRKLTYTAVMLAVLITLQFLTKSFGQIVTGSCVNFVLAASALLLGFRCAGAVALLSPILAFLLGIGPIFPALIPCIAAGNLIYVFLLAVFRERKLLRWTAPPAKFLLLFLLVDRIALPLLGLPAEKAAVIGASFSWPQLFTALIGLSAALLVCPRLTEAIGRS